LVGADVRRLPFRDAAFDLLICSQVIEHIEYDRRIFAEFRRLLAPGGILIVGTPDYAKLAWRITEWFYKRLAPGAYGDEHVTQFTFRSLTQELVEHDFEVLDHAYVGGGELIIKARRRSDTAPARLAAARGPHS
jgi:ubiquinone/menaquinone biosynthesis C-methylase UbiE